MSCGKRSWRKVTWNSKLKQSQLAEVGRQAFYLGLADLTGLVSDELMLEIVKAELVRLRGKVSLACSANSLHPSRPEADIRNVELDHRRFPENMTSGGVARYRPERGGMFIPSLQIDSH